MPSGEIVGTKDGETGVGIVDEVVGAVPLEDDRAFAVVGGGDALVRPVNQVGRVAKVDLGTIGFVLVPEAPVAAGKAEDARVDGAFRLEVDVLEWHPVEEVLAGEVQDVARVAPVGESAGYDGEEHMVSAVDVDDFG